MFPPQIRLDPHPLLDLAAFIARFPAPLSALPSHDHLSTLLRLDADAPVSADDATRQHVRDLLRHGGHKPSGRGRPASEFLRKAAEAGDLGNINPAVDVCNIVSLHSGLPISVVDLDRATPPLCVRIADPGSSYVFNRSQQEIRLDGLLCLHDADGPCANAVKDAQRTKTDEETQTTLSLVWGTRSLPEQTRRAVSWYRTLLEQLGAEVTMVVPAQ